MGVRFPSVASTTFVGPLPANANETLVLLAPPVNEPIDNAQVIVMFTACITLGTSTTGLIFLLKRGSALAGPSIIGTGYQQTGVAGNNVTVCGVGVDSPGVVANQQYLLSVQQTAATVAGVWVSGCLMAMVL